MFTIKISLIIAVWTPVVVVKLNPEKNLGLNEIQTHDDTGAVLHQVSYITVSNVPELISRNSHFAMSW